MTTDKTPVKNKELWQKLAHVRTKKVKWKWMRGHNGNRWNEACDQLSHRGRARKMHKHEAERF